MTLIGIISREGKYNNNETYVTYKNICRALFYYKAYPICIPNDEENFEKIKKIINICDGIVLQGGEQITDFDLKIVKYLYDVNIPTLGICLGMQQMAKLFNGKIYKTNKHNLSSKYVHYVKINKNSLLYKILNKTAILVNSKHNDIVIKTDLMSSGFSDYIIEAVEDKNKTFFLGVQWHPEVIFDDNSCKLFEAFLLACQNKSNHI